MGYSVGYPYHHFPKNTFGRKLGKWGEREEKIDILKGYFDKKEALGLKMGLLRRTDALKGVLDKIRAIWVENGTFREY